MKALKRENDFFTILYCPFEILPEFLQRCHFLAPIIPSKRQRYPPIVGPSKFLEITGTLRSSVSFDENDSVSKPSTMRMEMSVV